ncbi:GM19327 [Drosophila sechellia]|uniref:GM19327 n=1 Tax=Drosophila sechellia TaxID=7238 RepID=B4IKV0_DROSE|nr:GM19327 [Drosophila sechellia]
MRLVDIGINGIRNFIALMDLTAIFNNNTYYGIVKILQIAAKSIYEAVVKKAGTEEKKKTLEAENRGDILTVSGDGSWSKRGFTSRMGIVSVIGKYTNKILDVAVKSSFCKACAFWKGQEGTPEYEAWFETHGSECNVNHEDSAGKMEVDGIIEIFKRSEELHNAKYGSYIGDGDTKTFKMLLEAKPYGYDLRHEYCPPGEDSWCGWRKAEATGEEYTHPPALDEDVQQVLKPIYDDLTTEDLLERCTGANTQNNNESFNHCYDPILKILETMGCTIGPSAADFAAKYKNARITQANRRASLDRKEARTARRTEQSIEHDLFEEAEGILYGPGIIKIVTPNVDTTS